MGTRYATTHHLAPWISVLTGMGVLSSATGVLSSAHRRLNTLLQKCVPKQANMQQIGLQELGGRSKTAEALIPGKNVQHVLAALGRFVMTLSVPCDHA